MNVNKILLGFRRFDRCRLAQLRWASVQTIRRPPVVTIMGHVDHGKTSLLDYLRNSHIVEQEFGGITQHIGAFVVPFKQKDKLDLVTFLDTPGHAAFSAMRQRGANVTDIVVLVVACEDGIMDQTIESIQHAKASNVPIIVAANKIDRFESRKELEHSIRLLKHQLRTQDLITEDEGGDVQLVQISAKLGTGIETLKESILALAETIDLRAETNCPVQGRVIEGKFDQCKGKVATVLVQKGVIRKGSYLVAGERNWARVRALFDERQQFQQSCSPGWPIQITGWRENSIPSAGDTIREVDGEREAKSVVAAFYNAQTMAKADEDQRKASEDAEKLKAYQSKLTEELKRGRELGRAFRPPAHYKRDFISEFGRDTQQPRLRLLLKCDVDGSLDALLSLLDTYDRDNKQLVKLDLMHYGVGNITENDYTLASSFEDSVIYGFNVKPTSQTLFSRAKRDKVAMRLFNVIYELIGDLKSRIELKMPELERLVELGQALVMAEFIIRDKRRSGQPASVKKTVKTHIAGCRCTRGALGKANLFRLERNREVVVDKLQVASMRHIDQDVSEVAKGVECGLTFANLPEDVDFRAGDQLVAYEMQKYKPRLRWDLKGFA